MQAEHGGNDGRPTSLTVDAQIEADQRRIAELTKDGRVSRGDAVWQVRNENNAELVKENAKANAPGSHDGSEPQAREQSQAPSPEPERAGGQAGLDYSYAPNGMALHRANGIHHMQERAGRQTADREQDRTTGPQEHQSSPDRASDQPEAAPVRSEPGAERTKYRDMMRAGEARQISERTQDHGPSRD